MRFWFSLLLLVVIGGTAQAQQRAGPVGTPEGAWRAQIHWVPMTDGAGASHLLYARVCRPAGEAPARVVVIAHGSPPVSEGRSGMTPTSCDGEAARWFLQRQFVVIAAMRRGFGPTGGAFAEGSGPCNSPDYFASALEGARDLGAIVDYAAQLPFARPRGVVVVGQSAGGLIAVGYNSLPHPRVTALVSMAGGRGGRRDNQPNDNCRPDLLAAAVGRLARSATTPMLWAYTENDSYFAPPIAAAMYDSYSQNGGRAEFHQLGPFGVDGHRLFYGRGGSLIWGPIVERYLSARPGE